MAADECPPKICEVGQQGIFLPAFRDDEQQWPRPLRVALYLVGLLWCFIGVAVISDTFMSAIERITSKKTRRRNPKTGRVATVLVWNPTVANLTLMALGSSAPEILLSIIELLAGGFTSGDLGPSTIVGSAAFNLLCILAVCIAAIPSGESRHINDMAVYYVTASCSVFAYLWLLVILQVFSPDVVTVGEGVLTFLFFPVLIFAAFLADQGYLSKNPVKKPLHVTCPDMDPEELAECTLKVRQDHGSGLTDDQVMRIIDIEFGQKSTRATYRIGATRGITGGRRVKGQDSPKGVGAPYSNCVYGGSSSSVQSCKHETGDDVQDQETVIGFEVDRYAVLENVGKVQLLVLRTGDIKPEVTVMYRTRDGSAKQGSDYTAVQGELRFAPGERKKTVEVPIVDDNSHEEDEDFLVELFDLSCQDFVGGNARIDDARGTATVVIIDDDDPGVLRFDKEVVEVFENVEDITCTLTVHRVNGCTGTIGCDYKTEDGTAIAGPDFEHAAGYLEFGNEVMSKDIQLRVKARGRYEGEEEFRVVLFNGPKGTARFDVDTDGGNKECICTVMVKVSQGNHDQISRLRGLMKMNWDKNRLGHKNWKDQFFEALQVNGGEPGSLMDWMLHAASLPWKLLFALAPPVDYCDGWCCFFSALAFIGIVTAVIGDMAALLGCTMGLPDSVTAITFVALGTSLPDTFASKTAATQDPFADASIGNVTGSNSVNVFLGLGLPWMIGAFYWRGVGADEEWRAAYPDQALLYPEGAFVVKAGSLTFSVTVFSLCAVTCMALLFLRRKFCGGELGGEAGPKWLSAAMLVMLWLTYVGLSTWYVFTNSDCL